ncbi:hypothetical protein E2C01_038697 [Portunus trituberculatus]|uniref:Uncharacterized protein n=1 Tax=Portunus trituberculatus TaxID=210409 RepID=A0A5B7FKS1_PORTR|nr:hypothetical protein [Portunus trituberculatus]
MQSRPHCLTVPPEVGVKTWVVQQEMVSGFLSGPAPGAVKVRGPDTVGGGLGGRINSVLAWGGDVKSRSKRLIPQGAAGTGDEVLGCGECSPPDASNPRHNIELPHARGAQVINMAGPGEARALELQSQEGVVSDSMSPDGHPVLDCRCSLLQVPLRLSLCCSPADNGDILSVNEKMRVARNVEV